MRQWFLRRRPHDFNPRSPHRERRIPAAVFEATILFQSTLPSQGATSPMFTDNGWVLVFQSTLPSQGATQIYEECHRDRMISIHAPLTGSDVVKLSFRGGLWIFQSTLPSQGATFSALAIVMPTSPFQSTLPSQGATKAFGSAADQLKAFQSTLPSQGATDKRRIRLLYFFISIHAPLTGSDQKSLKCTA